MDSQKPLVHSILKYLDDQKNSDTFDDDQKESLEVASQCLGEVFGVSLNDSYPILKTLSQMFQENSPNQKASVNDKEQAEVQKALGNDYMKSEQYDEAIDCYTKAIENDAMNPVYYSNRAAAYSKANLHSEAIKDCDSALCIDKNYSKAYGRKGLALSALNKFKEAVTCYQKALDLDPQNESYKQNLSIAESRASEGSVDADASAMPGGFNFGQLLNNPNMMNMASQFMQNPEIQSMMQNVMQGGAGAGTGAGADTGADNSGQQNMSFERLLNVGQQMARQIQETNPALVDQLRTQMGDSDPKPEGQ